MVARLDVLVFKAARFMSLVPQLVWRCTSETNSALLDAGTLALAKRETTMCVVVLLGLRTILQEWTTVMLHLPGGWFRLGDRWETCSATTVHFNTLGHWWYGTVLPCVGNSPRSCATSPTEAKCGEDQHSVTTYSPAEAEYKETEDHDVSSKFGAGTAVLFRAVRVSELSSLELVDAFTRTCSMTVQLHRAMPQLLLLRSFPLVNFASSCRIFSQDDDISSWIQFYRVLCNLLCNLAQLVGEAVTNSGVSCVVSLKFYDHDVTEYQMRSLGCDCPSGIIVVVNHSGYVRIHAYWKVWYINYFKYGFYTIVVLLVHRGWILMMPRGKR